MTGSSNKLASVEVQISSRTLGVLVSSCILSVTNLYTKALWSKAYFLSLRILTSICEVPSKWSELRCVKLDLQRYGLMGVYFK